MASLKCVNTYIVLPYTYIYVISNGQHLNIGWIDRIWKFNINCLHDPKTFYWFKYV